METVRQARTERLASHLLSSRGKFLDYIRRRIADPELAEDILQESLLRAIRAASSVRDDDRLVPWFRRVLQNAIVDAHRRREVERKYLVDEGAAEEPSVELEDLEDDTTLCACFQDLIPTLKPEYAEIILAVELGNEAPETAAERLGITPNNLKVRRHRARQALRRRLEETCRLCAEHHCLDCACRGESPPAARRTPEGGVGV
jgi:RNA polymerase sigma-70 factor, ECF subfamily